MSNYYELMLVTQKQQRPLDEYLAFIECCISAGVTSVQLREKSLAAEPLLAFGKALHALLKTYKIPLIVNDSLDLALVLDAEGLHLGQDDGDVNQARKALGNKKIIGLSVNSQAELLAANELAVDYLGVGAIFPTLNKPDIKKIWGVGALQEAVRQSNKKIIAIGGVGLATIDEILATAVAGVAAIGVFHDAADPVAAIKTLCSKRKMIKG